MYFQHTVSEAILISPTMILEMPHARKQANAKHGPNRRCMLYQKYRSMTIYAHVLKLDYFSQELDRMRTS